MKIAKIISSSFGMSIRYLFSNSEGSERTTKTKTDAKRVVQFFRRIDSMIASTIVTDIIRLVIL